MAGNISVILRAGDNTLWVGTDQGVVDKKNKEIILKIVNTSSKAIEREVQLEGAGRLNNKGSMQVLKSDQLDAVNSIEQPKAVSPVEESVRIKGNQMNLTIAPYSLSVVKLKMK